MRLSLLLSDYLIYILVIAILAFAVRAKYSQHWQGPWRQVMMSPLGAISAVILSFYALLALLDSIHFQVVSSQQGTELRSVLDLLMSQLEQNTEQTYSAPFAHHLYVPSIINAADGQPTRGFARLQHSQGSLLDILFRITIAIIGGALSFLILFTLILYYHCFSHRLSFTQILENIFFGKTNIAWRPITLTFLLMWIIVWICVLLAGQYHIFGTDKVGRDVFYLSIKSIRTGVVIGTITTLFTLPFALLLGTIAGYFRGWIDDVIQFIYTTLSSIPDVLLISAAVLMLQVYMAKNAAYYPSLAVRADVRLVALCFILAITGWATLCRFLRAETLKLRELEFVQAAQALGVKKIKIILRHIFPNVFHIVLITLVLDFSILVLAEAVLSYIGVGVDPTTISWGNMINSSRLELAREPIVWWPLLAALITMFGLVLSANVFADKVRDAFDPHLRIRENRL